MNRIAAILGQLVLMLAGYALASLAASTVIVALILSPFGWTAEELPHVLTGSLLVVIPFVALFVAFFAFTPAMVALLAIELIGLKDWIWNALVGAAVGLAVYLAHFDRVAIDAPASIGDAPFMLAFAAAGLAGGMAYWLVAGRSAGDWRGRSTALPPPPTGD